MSEQNALAVWESPKALAERINRMIAVQKSVMKADVDYGIIPGCKIPTLFKPGAELLCSTFQLGDRMALGYPEVEHDEDGNYTVTIILEFYPQSTGVTIGQGIGVASTAEEKYSWRGAVCNEEFENAQPEFRREKWFKGYRGGDNYSKKQIRTNPRDMLNTVTKMAKKRAKVDGTLNVLGASRVFAQDLEDLPEGYNIVHRKGLVQSTKPIGVEVNQGTPKDDLRKKNRWISEKQEKRLYKLAKDSEVSIDAIKASIKTKMGLEHIYMLSWEKSGDRESQYNTVCKTIEENPKWFDQYEPNKETLNEKSFANTVRKTAAYSGLKGDDNLNIILDAEFGCSITSLPDDKKTKDAIIRHFEGLITDENER